MTELENILAEALRDILTWSDWRQGEQAAPDCISAGFKALTSYTLVKAEILNPPVSAGASNEWVKAQQGQLKTTMDSSGWVTCSGWVHDIRPNESVEEYIDRVGNYSKEFMESAYAHAVGPAFRAAVGQLSTEDAKAYADARRSMFKPVGSSVISGAPDFDNRIEEIMSEADATARRVMPKPVSTGAPKTTDQTASPNHVTVSVDALKTLATNALFDLELLEAILKSK